MFGTPAQLTKWISKEIGGLLLELSNCLPQQKLALHCRSRITLRRPPGKSFFGMDFGWSF